MSQALYTIEEYIAEHRKKDSIWIVFNTRYNEIHALKKHANVGECYDEIFTDKTARKEFLNLMETNFPTVTLIEIFDLVGATWLQWPYLGSIAIDTDIGSDVYKVLSEKYGDAYEDPKSINQVLWVMEYKDAKAIHDKRCENINEKFDKD